MNEEQTKIIIDYFNEVLKIYVKEAKQEGYKDGLDNKYIGPILSDIKIEEVINKERERILLEFEKTIYRYKFEYQQGNFKVDKTYLDKLIEELKANK